MVLETLTTTIGTTLVVLGVGRTIAIALADSGREELFYEELGNDSQQHPLNLHNIHKIHKT